MEIATSDNGNEPIYARQYGGGFRQDDPKNVTNEAVLLDGSGNTKFPHNVTAANFKGHLAGNADTATKLATPRAISLTGNATGSTTFDGSGNASINTTVNESKHAVNADTASKLSTARKINITGNATGAAAFDGSGDVSINVTVNESKHAVNANKATTATKVNATAPDGGTADLVFGTMAQNDFARVRVGGSDNNGWLEIATSDDGKEPIYVRQYGGAVWPNGNVVNEVALLDTSGNTKFPHNVTAANFKGHLAGNADTATKLATPRAISLTGNATGSANFDGSGNVSINATVNESKHAAAADTLKSSAATETDTTARPVWLSWAGDNTKQTVTPNLTYTCSTKTLTAANFKGHLAGNADTASTASSVAWSGITGKPGTYPPSAHNHDSAYPSVTGTRASGTWGINISGNAASATNADKLDGYHASDIINRISAANTGGIVAASLTENGYVKFANGLILQWGIVQAPSSAQDVSITFPISFSNKCYVVQELPIGKYPHSAAFKANQVSAYNKTGFTTYIYEPSVQTGVMWFAIGK